MNARVGQAILACQARLQAAGWGRSQPVSDYFQHEINNL
jgi:hypothetical protein